MKKKLLSLLIAFSLILPFGFALTACGGHKHTASTEWSCDDENHWKVCTDKDCGAKIDEEEHDFTEETIEATIDEDGKIIKTCSVCEKVVETTIPKIVQTKAEMIAVLANAVKLENYEGAIQEIYTWKSNTENYVSASETEVIEIEYTARKADGTAVNYTSNSVKPTGYTGSEYITDASYFNKVGNDYQQRILGLDNEDTPTKTDVNAINNVGAGYSQGFVLNAIKTHLDYLLEIKDEETMDSVLKNTLAQYIPMYQGMFAGYFNDTFTYDVDDIRIDVEVSYANGKYSAVGEIVLDELTHTNPAATQKINDFKVEFEVVYTNDLVVKNYSTFVYHIDTTPNVANDELTEVYIENNYDYSKTIENSQFEKIESIVTASQKVITPNDKYETVRLHVNGREFTSNVVKFGTKINTVVDGMIQTYLLDEDIDDYSTISVYLDKDYQTEYRSNVDVIVSDYYGTDVYVKIVANQNYAVILSCYNVYFENVDYTATLMRQVTIVTKDGSLPLEYTSYNPDYDSSDPLSPQTVEYDDKLVINGTQKVYTDPPASIEVELNEYIIDYYYYTIMDMD